MGPEPPVMHKEVDRRASAAREVLASLVRALKAVRLYPAGNRIVRTTLLELNEHLENYLEEHGDLALTVTRSSLYQDGEPVHEDAHSELRLAFQLMLESVRELTIHTTVTPDEVTGLVEVLARLGRRSDDVDDLETLLWQEDFEGITVLILDRFYDDLDDEEDFLEFVEEGGPDPHASAVSATEHEELTDVLGDASALLNVPTQGLGILDAEDRLRLEGLLAEEARRDAMTTFGSILVDVLSVEEDPAAFEKLSSTLARQLRMLVEQRELLRAARIASDAEFLLDRLEDEGRRQIVEEALAAIPTELVAGELPDAVAEADEEGLVALRILLSRLARRDPEAVVRLLEPSELRDLAMAALEDHLDRLLPYLASRVRDPRPAVVQAVLKLLAGAGDERASAVVAEAARHPEARVRVAAVRAAADLPGGEALIERALSDDAEDVRLAALQSPTRALGESIVRRLKERIASKEIAHCTFLEKREVFHALARGGREKVVPFLHRIISRKRLFRRDRTDELRACAAFALGAVGTPDALEILDRHLEDRSDRVREAAFGAMREAATRRR